MSATTQISWTDRTWNPVVGCTKVSQGCKHCYAKTLHDMRHKAFEAGKIQNIPQYAEPFETVQTIPARLRDPLGWRKPARVFVNSMSDLFHEDVPFDFIAKVWSVMDQARRHSFQILTKRPERMLDVVSRLAARHTAQDGSGWPLPNVWLGVSVENQAAWNTRMHELAETPAAVRFLSCEPLLGPVDLCLDVYGKALDWVIVGGESGKGARPMHPEWARSLRDQCQSAHVAFHFKQWGNYAPMGHCTADMPNVEGPDGLHGFIMGPATKDGLTYVYGSANWLRMAGRKLDGREWDEFPETRA